MNDHDNDVDSVEIMPLGDLRMIGVQVPAHLADRPDTSILCVPRSIAEQLAVRILQRWEVPDTAAKRFLEGITNDTLGDLLATHQLIRVMLTSNAPSTFVQSRNEHFDGLTLWQVIEQGRLSEVRQHLAHHVFSGGW